MVAWLIDLNPHYHLLLVYHVFYCQLVLFLDGERFLGDQLERPWLRMPPSLHDNN